MDPYHLDNWNWSYDEDIALNEAPNGYLLYPEGNDTGGSGTGNTVTQAAGTQSRKSINDKAYRARCKEKEKCQNEELAKLAADNARMRDENDSLKKQKDTVLSPKLQEAATKIKQLSSENHSLKRTSDYQGIVLEAFTEKMGSRDKFKNLHDEAAQSSESVIQDPRMQEKKRLLEERSRLENENRLLELQNEAYFRMIQDDRNPTGDEAD